MFVYDFHLINTTIFSKKFKILVFLEIDFQYLEAQSFDIFMKKLWRELTEHLF